MSRAGFFTGILLLVVLSAVTDWTIRLIVTNAKLSGTKSYIGIMDRCFGSSGRAAVSFFQFSFAFGGTYVFHNTLRKPSHPMIGMCAFGIIIGAFCVVFEYHSHTHVRCQGTRSRTSSVSYFPTFLLHPSSLSLPTVDSSSRSPLSAFPTRYHCTATSTNSPLRLALRFAG